MSEESLQNKRTICFTGLKRKERYTKLLILAVLAALTVMMCLTSCAGGTEEDAGAERIPILAYHKIVPAGTEFESSLLIAEDTFEEQMKYLHDEGYTTLTPDELCEWYDGKKFPEKSVMITFDDGYYCAGFEFLVYPLKWSSFTVRASVGIDLSRNIFVEGIKNNKEIFIGLGLEY